MEPLGLRTNLAEEFRGESKEASYPYLLISKFGGELALLCKGLQPGQVPIVVKVNGILRQIHSCELSAIELSKINRVYEYDIVLSATDARHITSTLDIMEVLPWMVSSSSH